ncbi:MAG TPA: alkaline phosphatase family protein, partial [Pelomicrobium sp.]|nr:alkaline phosphatase family protein [Pelomicrobium sp.]
IEPDRIFVGPPLFDRLQAESWVVSPRGIIDSDYNRAHCGGARRIGYGELEELFGLTAAAVRESRGRAYVYAYTPEFDALAHVYGVGSAQCLDVLRRVEAGFEAMLGALAGTDTAIVVTADHGFIDTVPERRLELADFPALAELLEAPLWGEPRVVYCRPRPGREAEFGRRARELLAGKASVRPSAELVEAGWFGPGPSHPRLAERIGGWTLVMQEDYTLKDWLPGEKRFVQVGIHGGVSADEMYIPLVAVNV